MSFSGILKEQANKLGFENEIMFLKQGFMVENGDLKRIDYKKISREDINNRIKELESKIADSENKIELESEDVFRYWQPKLQAVDRTISTITKQTQKVINEENLKIVENGITKASQTETAKVIGKGIGKGVRVIEKVGTNPIARDRDIINLVGGVLTLLFGN